MKRVFSQTFCVAWAIIEKDWKFCLVKENSKWADRWKYNQPSWWIELWENPISAVKKEVLEETWLVFEPTWLVGIFSLERNDLIWKNEWLSEDIFPHPIKLIFRWNILWEDQNKLEKDEISSVEWFTADEIFSMTQDQLRDIDIKKEVEAYIKWNNFPLDMIFHTIQS